MQKAERILSLLGQTSAKKPNFVFRRIYRYLFNPDLYFSVDSMSNQYRDPAKIDQLIDQLRWERYTPGDFSQDLYLKQAVYRLLQAIYQPLTLSCNPSTVHKALFAVREIFPANGWIIQMPSKHFFQQVQSDVLITILSQKIDDGRFIALIRRLLHQDSDAPFWIDLMLQELDRWLLQKKDTNIQYVRYQEQIFLLIQDTKSQAKCLLQEMNQWFCERLGIEGLADASKIDWMASCRFLFLDHLLKLDRNQRIGLYIPTSTIHQRLRPFRKKEKPSAYTTRIHLPIQKCILLYQRERRAFEEYFALAQNFKKKRRFFVYIHFNSLLKTIARKKNLSVKKVQKKYRDQLAKYWI